MTMNADTDGKLLPPAALFRSGPGALVLACLLLAGCDGKQAAQPPYLEQVKVETAALSSDALRASGTGEIKARVESNLSFKASGRVLSRSVNVGDHVKAGQVLATLDPTEQKADIEAARAAVAAQEATLRMATSALQRRQTLTKSGVLAQKELDAAEQQFRSAESDLASLKARLATAEEGLAQTELKADADGVITARNVETGQVVQPSTSVYTLAHDGDRDAVFNVQESALSGTKPPISLEVALLSNPEIKAQASLREVSPALDRSLGTVRVKLAIEDPPPDMTLGSPIVANVEVEKRDRIYVTWQALTSKTGKPAVWVVDPKTKTVSLRELQVDRYDTSRVVLTGGLKPGELFVTEGAKFLREEQQVAYSEGAAQ